MVPGICKSLEELLWSQFWVIVPLSVIVCNRLMVDYPETSDSQLKLKLSWSICCVRIFIYRVGSPESQKLTYKSRI
jgi:hypothetical protein